MVKKIPFRTNLTDSEESLSERSEISPTRLLRTHPPVAAPEPVPHVPNDITDRGPVEDEKFDFFISTFTSFKKNDAVLASLEDERDELLLQLPPGGYSLYLRGRRATLPECSY